MLSYVELTVVYPFFLLPAVSKLLLLLFYFVLFYFIFFFFFFFCLIMLTCYNLMLSDLPVKIDRKWHFASWHI